MTSDQDQPATTGESPVDEPTDDIDEKGSDATATEGEGSKSGMVLGLAILAVVLVAVLVLALTTGSDETPSAGPGSDTTAPRSTAPTLPPEALTTYHDDATGFSMQYPTSWQRQQTPVSELRLVITPGQGEAVSVRVNTTEQATTPENLGNVKAITDGSVGSNPSAKVLNQAAVTVNGLIGYWYLYTFTDQASRLEGVHVHYFLFKDHNMYSVVFQVLPTEDFSRFEGIFDQMIESFKVDPTSPAQPTTVPQPTVP